MPNFFSIASRARPPMRVTSSPSTKILPSSARRMPNTHLIITDLPVPEPPITTKDSAAPILRSMPSSTTLSPKRFLTPRSSILGVPCAAISVSEQEGGEEIIRGKDQDGRRHNGIGRRRTHALRAALGMKAVVAAHQRDDEAEHRNLDHAGNHV